MYRRPRVASKPFAAVFYVVLMPRAVAPSAAITPARVFNGKVNDNAAPFNIVRFFAA